MSTSKYSSLSSAVGLSGVSVFPSTGRFCILLHLRLLDVLTIAELLAEADVVTGASSVTTGNAVVGVLYGGCIAGVTTENVIVVEDVAV